jgi:hypothetical protein
VNNQYCISRLDIGFAPNPPVLYKTSRPIASVSGISSRAGKLPLGKTFVIAPLAYKASSSFFIK